MSKPSTIDRFFKRIKTSEVGSSSSTSNINIPVSENQSTESPTNDINQDNKSLVRDPGLRRQIWDYPVNERDEIRRAYIKAGPFQPILDHYNKSGRESHKRSFQSSWFTLFSTWLEYSPTTDAAYCLHCFLFSKPTKHLAATAFTVDGFKSWRKVRNGNKCAFLTHVGQKDNHMTPHKIAERASTDLMNQSQHIERVVEKYNSQEIANNRLRVKATIEVVRWLAFQGCAFRGHDESSSSINRGNFLELLELLASNNEKVGELVLDKAPKNACYTSPDIQKEILQVFATRVKNEIRKEIGDAKFCIIVDEARDESKKEQMSIVLRFVDQDGILRERFFGLVHVSDTAALTLKKSIYFVLSNHNLDIQNIRGQGYDGASNMRGEWNGLQALILKDCPYAYYIHCLAHQLQLALVAASKEVISIHHFFTKLTSIVNIVGASCKRNDEFKHAHAAEIAHLIDIDELKSGTGLNQIGTLQRPGDTRWSSHYRSVSSLIKMFGATCAILIKIVDEGTTFSQRGEADAAYEAMTSFEFIFILHLVNDIMEITNLLCLALQQKSQDILNAMHLVSSTKRLIQQLRDTGWDTLFAKVCSFCEARNIDVPDMNARYVARRGRARQQQANYTIEQYYQVDIFYAAIDSQLQELNNRFSEQTIELVILSTALEPREGYEYFRIDDICKLVNTFYPHDFADHEKLQLKMQLQHYEYNVVQHSEFRNLLTLSSLCQWLVRTRRSTTYPLVHRIIVLVLTLPVSTATTERSFSAMRIVKTRLRNKMEDDFLTNSLIIYIEREIAEKLSIDSIIDDFRDLKERRVPF